MTALTERKRSLEGLRELEKFHEGKYSEIIDVSIENVHGESEKTAKIVYEAYLKSLAPQS